MMIFRKLQYQLIRCCRKTIALQVKPDGELIVRAPKLVPISEIDAFVERSQEWIHNCRIRLSQQQSRIPDDVFHDGLLMPFLGELYPVELSPRRAAPIHAPAWRTRYEDGTQWKSVLTQLYKKSAHELLPGRLQNWGKRLNISYRSLRISGAEKRWGSCSGRGSINLSWRLMMFAPNLIDYVIVHELIHRLEMNHGPKFYALMDRYFPNHAACRVMLRRDAAKWGDLLSARISVGERPGET